MSEPPPLEPFFLIIADHARGVFAVEGPMTDDSPWQSATRHARDISRASPAARPALIVTRLPRNTGARTSSPAFRPAAS